MIRRLYKMLSKALPLFYALLVVLPLYCSLFISDEKVTVKNKVCLIIIVAIIALITHLISERNISMERAQNMLSVEILKGERNITKIRYDMIFASFKNVLLQNGIHQKLNYNPYEKIVFILNAISLCFEAFLDVRPKYISVALFYHFNSQSSDIWNRLDKNHSLSEVILENNSFGKYVMEGTEGFYLINDKYWNGVRKNVYKLNQKDIETKRKFHKYGSIMGAKMVVKVDNTEYIHAFLTVSTYGKKIDNVPFEIFRERLERKIEDDILPIFKINIESELMQIYLKEINS